VHGLKLYTYSIHTHIHTAYIHTYKLALQGFHSAQKASHVISTALMYQSYIYMDYLQYREDRLTASHFNPRTNICLFVFVLFFNAELI